MAYPSEKTSLNPPAYTNEGASSSETAFASLSLHQTDRIRLLQFSATENGIREVIRRNWHRGIQSERPYSSSHEFKLSGNPWDGQGSDAIPARIVIREILAYLYSIGWVLYASTDVSKKRLDKDTLIFRKVQPPPVARWVSISFNQHDRLRLIGAPPELISAVQNLLRSMRFIQQEFWKERHNNAYEFKLNGYPWTASGEETMRTRLLLLKLVEVLETNGWSLYASIDQNNGTHGNNSDESETDSWYCVQTV